MTCNVCGRAIHDDAPMVILKIARPGWRVALRKGERFTGVAWHIGCAPTEREHLQNEARAFMHRAPETRGGRR